MKWEVRFFQGKISTITKYFSNIYLWDYVQKSVYKLLVTLQFFQKTGKLFMWCFSLLVVKKHEAQSRRVTDPCHTQETLLHR